MDLYKHLKQFVTTAPMIERVQEFIAGKMAKKVS
jgi:hypothetical protein